MNVTDNPFEPMGKSQRTPVIDHSYFLGSDFELSCSTSPITLQ